VVPLLGSQFNWACARPRCFYTPLRSRTFRTTLELPPPFPGPSLPTPPEQTRSPRGRRRDVRGARCPHVPRGRAPDGREAGAARSGVPGPTAGHHAAMWARGDGPVAASAAAVHPWGCAWTGRGSPPERAATAPHGLPLGLGHRLLVLWVRACVHVCACMCMRACMRASGGVLACVRASVRACVRACMRACVRACVQACLFVCAHAHPCAHPHPQPNNSIHISTRTSCCSHPPPFPTAQLTAGA